MEINGIQVCNVCLKEANPNENAVFVQANCRGEAIHICTACIPHVIHGSGDIVKTNSEVEKEVQK